MVQATKRNVTQPEHAGADPSGQKPPIQSQSALSGNVTKKSLWQFTCHSLLHSYFMLLLNFASHTRDDKKTHSPERLRTSFACEAWVRRNSFSRPVWSFKNARNAAHSRFLFGPTLLNCPNQEYGSTWVMSLAFVMSLINASNCVHIIRFAGTSKSTCAWCSCSSTSRLFFSCTRKSDLQSETLRHQRITRHHTTSRRPSNFGSFWAFTTSGGGNCRVRLALKKSFARKKKHVQRFNTAKPLSRSCQFSRW